MSNFLWITVIVGICPISRVPRHDWWQINGKSRKWQSIRNYSQNKTFSTKFNDLGVIIMRKRCSIQQGEKNNCWSEQSPKNRLFLFFWPPGIYNLPSSFGNEIRRNVNWAPIRCHSDPLFTIGCSLFLKMHHSVQVTYMYYRMYTTHNIVSGLLSIHISNTKLNRLLKREHIIFTQCTAGRLVW